jgi:hypothetical protein
MDGHVAACISCGDGPVAMNVMTELWLGMSLGQHTMGYRGWSEADVALAVADLERRGLVAGGMLTPAGRHLRDDIEERTDAMQQSVIDAIGSDFEAGSFPPDIFKRATG